MDGPHLRNAPLDGNAPPARPLRPIVGLLCASLLAAGCMASGTEPPDEFVPVFETPGGTAESSPTATSSLTIAELGPLFLACADAYNAESARLLKEEQRASTLEQLAAVAASRSANADVFAGCLGAIDWPDALDSDVREVVDTLTGLQAVEDQMASAPSLDELRGYRQAWNEAAAAVSVAANALRADLDLPPS